MAFCIKASVVTHVTTIMFLVSLFKKLDHSIRQHALSGRCSSPTDPVDLPHRPRGLAPPTPWT